MRCRNKQKGAALASGKMFQKRGGVFGLIGDACEFINHFKRAVLQSARERNIQSFASHLIVNFLREIAIFCGTKRNASSFPQRRPDRAVARPSGSFLPPGFPSPATDLAAPLRMCQNAAAVSLPDSDDLMNQIGIPR